MTNILAKIKRGTSGLPNRFVIAGPEGIGKSTLGSKAPNPVFISPEDGLTGLEHVQRLTPTNLDEVHSLLDALLVDPNGYETVVIDTSDWLERLICKSVCARDNKTDIEDYGYGKGYVVLENELVRLLQKLDELRLKGLGTIILSHVHIKPFTSPEGEAWDRYEMKGHKRFTGILREWADACLFATVEVFKTKIKGENRDKAVGGERVLRTQWSPAWDAKNRLNLPEKLPLDWDALQAAVKSNTPEALRERVKALFATAKMDDATKARWEKWINKIESHSSEQLTSAITKLAGLQG